jgi:hypothetical protein
LIDYYETGQIEVQQKNPSAGDVGHTLKASHQEHLYAGPFFPHLVQLCSPLLRVAGNACESPPLTIL